eukprot:1715501-Prymnesium_polylepis.1
MSNEQQAVHSQPHPTASHTRDMKWRRPKPDAFPMHDLRPSLGRARRSNPSVRPSSWPHAVPWLTATSEAASATWGNRCRATEL